MLPTLSDFAVRPDAPDQHGASKAQVRPKQRSFVARLLGKLPFKWRILIALPATAGLVVAAALVTMMVYYTIAFPHPLAIRSKEHAPVVRILARDGSVLAERGAGADYMPLDLLPKHVWGAVVATEDRRFFDHYGLDPLGLARAFFINLRAGRFVQGGSTLTQQLAKNLFLSPERTLARKFEELGLALWLELRLSKADILELYLNRVYFGSGAYGIEAASQRYFDKSARELTLAEAALIAGLLKAPSKYSPASSPDMARARSRVVLAKMLEAGIITFEQERRAQDERLTFIEPKAHREASSFGYAIDYVLDQLPPLADGGDGEVIVETTFDANLQQQASEIVASALAKDGPRLGAQQAAAVVLDTEGGIRAMVGGSDFKTTQFNRAVKARRQPGSSFKPFVYLAALESGMTPETIAYDLPISIGGWAPRNDNGEYIGEVTLRQALAQSINSVAVRLNQIVGTRKTIAVANRLGIGSPLGNDGSLALGTSEVSLLEMAGAYDVLANGGDKVEPHAIRRVRMSSGRVLFARDVPRNVQIVDPLVVGSMNDMMNAGLVAGTGRRAGLMQHPAAGKTGTTQEFRDAWFIGYTAHLTGGVWLGNDDGKPMRRAVGGGLPADIWHRIMEVAHRGKAPLLLPGTTLESGTALQVASLSWSRSGPARGVPRVGRIIETLPWLGGKAAVQQTIIPRDAGTQRAPAAALSPETGSVRQQEGALRQDAQIAPRGAPMHPQDRIGEDFVNQMLAESATPNGEQTSRTAAKSQTRPTGLMSLGGWW